MQEMYSEVIRAIGSMSDINYQPAIDKASYSLVASAANNAATEERYGASAVNSGSFYIGLDLENYTNAPKDSIFAGYNSNTDDIYAVLTYSGSQPTTVVRFDSFAMFDSVIVFENDTAYCRY
jgi:acetylglutamate synthase